MPRCSGSCATDWRKPRERRCGSAPCTSGRRDVRNHHLEVVGLAERRLANLDATCLDGYLLWAVRRVQGRLSEAAGIARRLVRDYPGAAGLRAGLAELECALGREAAARKALRQAAADEFAAIPYDVSWLSAMIPWARVASGLGARAPAAALYRLLAPFHTVADFSGAHSMARSRSRSGSSPRRIKSCEQGGRPTIPASLEEHA